MKYLTSKEIANLKNILERQVRTYCKQGSILNSYLDGKTFKIPFNSIKPIKLNKFKQISLNLNQFILFKIKMEELAD